MSGEASRSRRRQDRFGSWPKISVAVVFALVVLVPFFLSAYRVQLIGGYLAFALLAATLSFVWGSAGILSFAQGLFFGIGMYSAAIFATRWDFAFGNAVGVGAAIALPMALALLISLVSFGRRLPVFFAAVVTFSASAIFPLLAQQFDDFTGGGNGIIILESWMPSDVVIAYWVMCGVLALSVGLLLWIRSTQFGEAVVALRDNEERLRFLGYDTRSVKTATFVIGAGLAGLGGAFYAMYIQTVSPTYLGIAFSTQVFIWVAIGGRASLMSAAVAALVLSVMSQELSISLADKWNLVLGLLFILVVVSSPEGAHGLMRRTLGFKSAHQATPRVSDTHRDAKDATPARDTPILDVRGVRKAFGSVEVLKGLTLQLWPGELLCLVGPNGAGKTTLIDVLSSRSPATGGEVLLGGASVLGKSPDRLPRLGLQRKFQGASVFEMQSVGENLRLASRGTSGLLSSLRRSREVQLPPLLIGLLQESGLDQRIDHDAGDLTHGERQWLELCMVLASEPRIVLLDEPTAGLSQQERQKIGVFLRSLVEQGLAVVLVEHDFDFVRQIADRVVVLHQGVIAADGTIEEVSTRDVVREIYLGGAAPK